MRCDDDPSVRSRPASDEGTPAGEAALPPAAARSDADSASDGPLTASPEEAEGVQQARSEEARQRNEYYDLLLRKTAEFDNYRRRVERERRELADYAVGEFVKELLPVVDDFTRALNAGASAATAEGLRQGVELIHRRLLDGLAKRGVVVIDPLGADFDPHLHEAVARVPAEDHRDGEIVEVFSHGYRLGDRLLRPAMVKVATA